MTFASYFLSDFSLGQYIEFAIRITVACICGGAIGYERTKRLKDAGIKTHIIVCCAAALVMIISKYGFADLGSSGLGDSLGVRGADPARIAAQVIGGISFLGAGVIFHYGNTVKGLTTAAGLWATAGIGMAVGSGMYVIGVFATVLITTLQFVIQKSGRFDTISTYSLKIKVKNSNEFKNELQRYIKQQNAKIIENKVDFDEDAYATYSLTLRLNHELTFDELDAFLQSAGEIKSISFTSVNN